jgi:hypothetical protein
MAKLQNIKAIKQMLDGTHRMQSKTTVGYEGDKNTSTKEVGETWIDANGKEWIQKDGFKISVNKFLDQMASTRMPSMCPK